MDNIWSYISHFWISYIIVICFSVLSIFLVTRRKKQKKSIKGIIAFLFIFFIILSISLAVAFTGAGGPNAPLYSLVTLPLLFFLAFFILQKFASKNLLLYILALLIMCGVFSFIVSYENNLYINNRYGRDSKKVSDIRQIELALELHYTKYNQYPKNLQKLIDVDKGFLSFTSLPINYTTKEPYSYSYGINKKNNKIEYYHIGARLRNENSDLLKNDLDYNSSLDTDTIDWQHDKNYENSCLTKNGFDGSDKNTCGSIYDRGIIPK